MLAPNNGSPGADGAAKGVLGPCVRACVRNQARYVCVYVAPSCLQSSQTQPSATKAGESETQAALDDRCSNSFQRIQNAEELVKETREPHRSQH